MEERTMQSLAPISTVELFPGLSAELLAVLRACSSEDWDKPTACPSWSVKDVVAHLLGGNIGRLSSGRDKLRRRGCSSRALSFDELVGVINRRNAEWVRAARRISPNLLLEFLELTDREIYRFFKTLDEHAPSTVAVAWAGDSVSPQWFDIAREYTEKWLHQQHIREAVGQPVLAARAWMFPVLDAFMRALPYAYRTLEAVDGTAVCVTIGGDAGGDWSLLRQNGAWQLFLGEAPSPDALVSLGQDLAWRLFSKGIHRQAAEARIRIDGDKALGATVLDVVAIMA
jgi:uncharacterized protein (TIGR03083 family)